MENPNGNVTYINAGNHGVGSALVGNVMPIASAILVFLLARRVAQLDLFWSFIAGATALIVLSSVGGGRNNGY
jgi:hypothetical protein